MDITEVFNLDYIPLSISKTDINNVNVARRNNSQTKFFEDTEAKTRLQLHNKGHSWLEYYRAYINFTSYILVAPFGVQTDDNHHRLVVRSNILQKSLCAVLQFCLWLSYRTLFVGQWEYVQSSADKSSYIDMLFVFSYGCYGAAIKKVMWFNQKEFQALFDEFATSPIMTIKSSVSPSKAKILMSVLFIFYAPTALCYASFMMGIDSTSTDSKEIVDKLHAHAEVMLFLPPDWRNSKYSNLLTVMATCITCYTNFFWHCGDTFLLISTIFIYHVTRDVLMAIQNEEIQQSEVMRYYDAYRRLNKKFNDAAGLFLSLFYPFILPYYSTHLVDMLNDSDYRNRFSMVVYLSHLGFCLVVGAKTNKMGRIMKKWINNHREYAYETISEQKLSLILDDLTCDRIGVCGIYTVTMRFVGQVANLILTLAIIAVQFKMKMDHV